MKYFSSFSGIGGFDIALNKCGHKCVGFSEIKSTSIQIYEERFPGIKNYGDIKRIKTLPNFDILVGGTPCQNFTILGNRKGLQGSESSLFYEFIKILKKKKPDYFIFENVKGSLSSNGGKDFAIMQIEFSKAGYNTEWQVLNSKNFGLSQNRERVYIIGYLGEVSFRRVFPIRTTVQDSKRNRIQEVNGGFHRYRTYSKNGISPTLTSFQRAGYARVKIEESRNRIRELTPIEYERLQGFPDNWTEGLNKYDRYELVGDAVSVNVVEEIIKRLTKIIYGK
jgi:DNA (cytosine-5)-methyltransferase 1